MRVTLQSRITATIIIFAVVLTASFAFIQVQNQLRIITIFNSLKAKLTAQILKDGLQAAIKNIPEGQNPKRALETALNKLRRSDLVKKAFVYSPSGTVEASTRSLSVYKKASSAESLRIDEVIRTEGTRQGFLSRADKSARTLQLYIPILYKGKPSHVARLDISLGNMGEALQQVYMPVIMTAAVVALVTIIFGFMLSKRIVGPVSLLNTATKEIAGGDLNLRIHMDTNDELEELASTFNIMAVELKKMKAKAENANPLTKLAGNLMIQEESERRIKSDEKFIVLYCDLDNFKAFNDKYGIHAGDDAIKLTAAITQEALEEKGNQDDFLGHEGGDDFILLTTPGKVKEVSDYIISEFDKRIRALYNKEDLERGYIEERTRHGNEIAKFPIMAISLAGVTNATRPIRSYGEITNIAAEVKKKAKNIEGSCLVIDKRNSPWPPDSEISSET